MKGSEQEAGNPLIGIPAKIADGFFLVALNDSKAETDANMTLLRRQAWIDIPVVYKSGRRALFTMEKGIPGDKVFDEALKAWAAEGAGSTTTPDAAAPVSHAWLEPNPGQPSSIFPQHLELQPFLLHGRKAPAARSRAWRPSWEGSGVRR